MNIEPWNISNCPSSVNDKEDWAKRCRNFCTESSQRKGFSLRTHLKCSKCGFGFIYRTSNYSLSHSADITNYGICCNPDCRYEWEEYS